MIPQIDIIVVLPRSGIAALISKGAGGSPAFAEGLIGQTSRTGHGAGALHEGADGSGSPLN